MIPVNFAYVKPKDEQEALCAFTDLVKAGKTPLYYGSGSEIIAMTTVGAIRPDAVIDVKAIPAMNVLEANDTTLTIGGAVCLEAIRDSGKFPLLGTTVGRIADHTNQCRITLGGNLCGTIRYREAVLPLLVADAELSLLGPNGLRRMGIHDVFDGRIIRNPDELLLQVHIPLEKTKMPFAHIKRTVGDKIGYPAATVAALYGKGIALAISGICDDPFRSAAMEAALSDRAMPPAERVEKALSLLPQAPVSDAVGTGAYRVKLLEGILLNVLEGWPHDAI